MAYVKKGFIAKAMQTNACRFFTVKEAGKLIATQQDNDLTIDEAIDLLNETIDNFTSGVLDIAISTKSNTEKARGGKGFLNFEYKVRIENDAAVVGGAGANVFALMAQVQDLQVKLMKKDEEVKFNDLQRQFNEFKKQGGNKNTEGLNKLAMALIPHFTGKTALHPPLAGHEEEETETTNMTTEQKKAELKKALPALQKLAKYDKDFVKHLGLLAAFAENNTEKYLSFIPMLEAL